MCLNIMMVATPLPSNTPMINISYQLKYSRFKWTIARSFNRKSLASLNQELKESCLIAQTACEVSNRASRIRHAKASKTYAGAEKVALYWPLKATGNQLKEKVRKLEIAYRKRMERGPRIRLMKTP